MASLFDLSLEFYALKDLMENDFEVDEETGEFIDNTETINNLFNGLILAILIYKLVRIVKPASQLAGSYARQ